MCRKFDPKIFPMRHFSQLCVHVGHRLAAVISSPSQDVFCAVFALLLLREALSAFLQSIFFNSRRLHIRNQVSTPSLVNKHILLIPGILAASFLGNGLIVVPVTDLVSNLFIFVISWLLLVIRLQVLLTRADATTRFRDAVDGAQVSILFVSLVLLDSLTTQEPALSTKHAICALLVSASALAVCLCVPKRQDEGYQGRPVDREHTCSLFERATFLWSRKVFSPRNIVRLNRRTLPALCRERRLKHLLRHPVTTLRRGSDSLGRALAWRYAPSLLLQYSLAVVKSFMALAPELVSYRLLQWLSGAHEGTRIYGITLAVLLGAAKLASVVITSWLKWVTCSKIQVPIQTTMNAMVYEKALRLPHNSERGSPSNGATLLEMRNCCTKACAFYTDSHEIIVILAKLVPAMVFLMNVLGWRSLIAGIAVTAIAMPLSKALAGRYSKTLAARTQFHEKRTGLLSSALLSIRQIKITAQENSWKDKLGDARSKELMTILSSALWMSLIVAAANISPIILAGVPVYVFTLLGNPLTAAVAFTSISVFKEIQSGIAMLPMTIPHLGEYRASLRRLESYLARPEIATVCVTPAEHVSLTNASISWHGENKPDENFALKNVSVSFHSGELSVITGKTGSGKSLLLAAIAGEVNLLSGKIQRPCSSIGLDPEKGNGESWVMPGHLAVVFQNPWMTNGTIRENILFGLPFDSARYSSVLHFCALEKDLSTHQDGDATIVGIKGATLSGGQRWRIALARALYSRASLLLFDDVLSAVDAEVREWIVDKALFGELAKGRTIILATHHESQIASRASCHIHISNNTAKIKADSRRAAFFQPSISAQRDNVHKKFQIVVDKQLTPVSSADLKGKSGTTDTTGTSENRHVPGATYKTYFDASGGVKTWIIALAVILSYECVSVCTSWWLKEWTLSSTIQRDMHNSSLPPGTTYILISIVECIFDASKCFVWYMVGMKASKKLSTIMVEATFGAHLQWLESTSHGEVLTLYNTNMSDVDEELPHALGFVIENLFTLATILITSASFSLYETPLIAAVLYLFITTGNRLISALRHLQSIQVVCTSTIQQHLSSLEASDGIATVRGFGMTETFTAHMHQMLDERFSAYWHFTLCRVMIEFQFGVLGALYIMLSCLFIVISGADAGTAGIALSFASRFSDTVSGTLKRWAAVETYLDSAQRIADYRNIAQEPIDGKYVPDEWPSRGEIRVENLVAGYDESSPATLKDLSFAVGPGERIGIVGRTGAGKSSLALAFARLIRQRSGSIYIDGVDIAAIKINLLRQRLLMIPQDPHISAGTVRSMLDPDGMHTDEVLLRYLTRFRLFSAPLNEASSSGLSFVIHDGGINLSMGQRQILHLIHAALSGRKVIIMDEATSAVDIETDAAIHEALRHADPDGDDGTLLQDATVLVVAHRLATVAGLDKVLVLSDGRVEEFGPPEELYKSQGTFWKLVNHSTDGNELVTKMGW